MTRETGSCGSRVLFPVVGAFAEMSSDVNALADAITSALAANQIQFFSTSAVEAGAMCKQRTWTAWGHAAHRGWAHLLLDRRKGLIDHGPRATCSARGKFDDEGEQRHGDHHHHYPGQFRIRVFDGVRL